MIVLNEAEISGALAGLGFSHPLDIHLLESIDSTNRYARELKDQNNPVLCCAEHQTQGRGRFNRHWYSPARENIYCSFRLSIPLGLNKLAGFSLMVSLSILKSLQQAGLGDVFQIKWPNDILWNHKKLSGCLIESLGEQNQTTTLIIGIGINVNSDTRAALQDASPWCSLYEITGKMLNRNLLIAGLVQQLFQDIALFCQTGLAEFMADWRAVDYLYQQKISLVHQNKTFTGVAAGINALGELIVEDTEGKQQYFSAGDTSLHQKRIRFG